MKPRVRTLALLAIAFGLALALALASCTPSPPRDVAPAASAPAASAVAASTATPACPTLGWSEGLARYLAPDATVATQEPDRQVDCDFHAWSWQTFVWATALDPNAVPRFMRLPTTDDLISSRADADKEGARPLRLAARIQKSRATSPAPEVAGAIVQADGNMMVAPNGYPVLASVHMNASYFKTAKRNMIHDGGYQKNPNQDDSFDVGAAVFKATWMRLDSTQQAPAGTFVTQAEVPLLKVVNNVVVADTDASGKGRTTQAKVALVGLHVVGVTDGHPEFLWATFEHKLNAPALADNSFNAAASDPQNYTFYAANTPFANANALNNPIKIDRANPQPVLSFDPKTQRFAPVTNAVLLNRTGGETNSPDGAANIDKLNQSAQGFLNRQSEKQAQFASYNLIGTVWFAPNAFATSAPGWESLAATDAKGSVNLANSTAETFFQVASDKDISKVQNCFTCHNAASFTKSPPNLATPANFAQLARRRVATSHALSTNAPDYAVANQMSVKP